MVPFSSHFHSLALKLSLQSHQMTTLFIQNDDFFTVHSNPLSKPKKLSFEDFLMMTWERKNKNRRKKKEPEILRPHFQPDFSKQIGCLKWIHLYWQHSWCGSNCPSWDLSQLNVDTFFAYSQCVLPYTTCLHLS